MFRKKKGADDKVRYRTSTMSRVHVDVRLVLDRRKAVTAR
jgi:hypothetical protein